MLFFGFYPKFGGAALYGPMTCNNDNITNSLNMICVDNCIMGCTNLLKGICESSANKGCHVPVFCVYKILNYHFVNTSDECLIRECYGGAICVPINEEPTTTNLYHLSIEFKGAFWGVGLVFFAFIFFVGGITVLVKKSRSDYKKIDSIQIRDSLDQLQ